MRAFFNILFLLVLALCLAAPYATGFIIQKRYDSMIAKLNSGYAGNVVFEGKFDRGYFSSHATTTITRPESDNVVLDHAIYHGPIVFKFEGWLKASNYKPRAIGLAVVETEILGKIGDKIAAFYQNNPAYNITTVVSFNSDFKTHIINYPIKAINQNQNIEWQGFTSDINISSDTGNLDLTFDAPFGRYLELIGNDLSSTKLVEISNLKVTYSKNIEESVETITIALQNIKAADDSDSTRINIDAIDLRGNTDITNTIMSTDWNFSFNDFEIDNQKLGPLSFELKMQNINIMALRKLSSVPLTIPVSGKNPAIDQSQIPQAEIIALLSNRPILDLNLALTIPLGNIEYKSHLEIGGQDITNLDWEQIWAGAVLSKDLKIATPIVHKVLLKYAQEKFLNNERIYKAIHKDENVANPYEMSDQQRKDHLANWVNNVLYALKQKKIIVEQDNFIIMDLNYKNDELMINGVKITEQDINDVKPMLEMHVMNPPQPVVTPTEPVTVTPSNDNAAEDDAEAQTPVDAPTTIPEATTQQG